MSAAAAVGPARAEPDELERLLAAGHLRFHEGRIRGAYPALAHT